MKKFHAVCAIVLAAGLAFGVQAFAAENDAAMIAAGGALSASLRSGQIQCASLSSADYENLGEYFMEQMMDGAHEAMDQAIAARSGEQGLEAMHVAMGERLSGCNPNAAFPAGMMGYGGMMRYGYYNGASSTPYQNYQFPNMMGYYGPGWGYGYGMDFGGWIFMAFFWILAIIAIVVFIRWALHGGRRHHGHGDSALDILKERYAKGEIDRKEFEEKKKDLSA